VLTDSFTRLLSVALCPREYTVNFKPGQKCVRTASFDDRRHRVSNCPIRRAQPLSIVPSRRAHAGQRVMRRRALSGRAHRPEPSPAVPSHHGPRAVGRARITLWRTDRATFISRVALASTTHPCKPHTHASHHRAPLHRAPHRASRSIASYCTVFIVYCIASYCIECK